MVVPWLKVTFKLDFFTILEVVSNPELVCTGCVTIGIIVGVILRLTEVSLCVLVWCTVVSAEVPFPLVVTELSSVQCGNEDVVFSEIYVLLKYFHSLINSYIYLMISTRVDPKVMSEIR